VSGPPYPRYNLGAAPGQNFIGGFVIGFSPIGDVAPFDVWTTMISQYSNSSIIDQLCTNMAQYVDETENMDLFYDTMWNVDTAVGYGLDVWGRIVGVGRVLALPVVGGDYLGFQEAGDPTERTGFGQGPFFSGETVTNNFTLTDAAYRPLVLAKALANICDGSIPSINQLLLNLFAGLGKCYVADGLNLTMTYTFDFVLSPVQRAIALSGVLPRTSGVSVSISAPT
jgi:hypothetical protein